MDPFDAIETKLAAHPEITFRREGLTLTVDPPTPTGFEVGFSQAGDTFLVWFEGWHEHFTTQEEALNAFAWGLSAECRLEVTYRGAAAVCWTIQTRVEETWCDESTTGALLSPFWRPKRVVHKQNDVLREALLAPAPASYTKS